MTQGSIREPTPPGGVAKFDPNFGQRVLLTVDTEEEFDWYAPFTRDGHGVEHVGNIARFQEFCEEIGAHPLYLVDWPIVQSPLAVEIIGNAVKRSKADVGVQLHAWVNPPFDEELTQHNSYAGNLPKELEAAKFNQLCEAIERAFGTPPMAYRAGRYGLGDNSVEIIKDAGIAIDTSVRPLFDYSTDGGPDYTHHPRAPYWADRERTLLELPVSSVYWGVLRQLGPQLQRLQRHAPTLYAAFSKFGLLERIALTPEGVTIDEAIRGVDIALDEGLPLLVLSFHSPSLAPGHTTYAKTQEEVDGIYEWLRQVYGYLGRRGVHSASISDVLTSVSQE